MKDLIKSLLEDKSIALLGFGREGRSTYNLIRSVFPEKTISILDENDEIRHNDILKNDPHLLFVTGKECMHVIDEYDVAIKSPGIPSNTLPIDLKKVLLTSQSDIFLQYFGHQSIGVTGTKGKSTTSSLIYHILKNSGKNALLVGNIGIPPFDCINEITPDSIIVLELSSHQLEYITHAPHIAVFLNLFQEHLDHYYTYEDYQSAKFNIGKYQNEEDFFIYNTDNKTLTSLIEKSQKQSHHAIAFSLEPDVKCDLHIVSDWIVLNKGETNVKLYNTLQNQPLKGHHNLYNIMAAAVSCYLIGISTNELDSGIKSFNGLEHRIENVGLFDGILWYNDSIATIPEATIEAVKTLHNVDTLILGGFDRGIEYGILYPFLNSSGISNIIFVGEAGARMRKEFDQFGVNKIKFYSSADYEEVVIKAKEITRQGMICLLSPAAASYDMFRNFEERGKFYKKSVRNLKPLTH